MSDDMEFYLKKYLDSKNNKPLVLFKTAALLEDPARNTVIERRKTTAWINKRIKAGGFVVGNYWITQMPNDKQLYSATLLGSLSSSKLLELMCEIMQCDHGSLAHALYINNEKMKEMEESIQRFVAAMEARDQMIADMCNRCLPTSSEKCRKRTCPLWGISPRASWRK